MWFIQAVLSIYFVTTTVLSAGTYAPLTNAVLHNAPANAICGLMCLFVRGSLYMAENKQQFANMPSDYQQCAVMAGDMSSITQCITTTCPSNDMRTDLLTGLNDFQTDCTTNNRKNFTHLVSCYNAAVPLSVLLNNNTFTPSGSIGTGIHGACSEAHQTVQNARQACPDLTPVEQNIFGIFTYALFTKYLNVTYQSYQTTCIS